MKTHLYTEAHGRSEIGKREQRTGEQTQGEKKKPQKKRQNRRTRAQIQMVKGRSTAKEIAPVIPAPTDSYNFVGLISSIGSLDDVLGKVYSLGKVVETVSLLFDAERRKRKPVEVASHAGKRHSIASRRRGPLSQKTARRHIRSRRTRVTSGHSEETAEIDRKWRSSCRHHWKVAKRGRHQPYIWKSSLEQYECE